jgi:PadR family transcriptional regulator, regulatory protein PadR
MKRPRKARCSRHRDQRWTPHRFGLASWKREARRVDTYRLPVYDDGMGMTDSSYFILASLQAGPLHGYGIIKRAEQLSSGHVNLSAGTLYGAIDRLIASELIELDSEEIVEGRARKSYVLTEHGRQGLIEEAQRLAAAARVVTARPAVRRQARLA